MIFIIFGLLIAILGVANFFSLVSWFFENHHIFDIIGWFVSIHIFVVLGCVAVVILYFIYWLITDLIQWTIKKIKNKKAQEKISKA